MTVEGRGSEVEFVNRTIEPSAGEHHTGVGLEGVFFEIDANRRRTTFRGPRARDAVGSRFGVEPGDIVGIVGFHMASVEIESPTAPETGPQLESRPIHGLGLDAENVLVEITAVELERQIDFLSSVPCGTEQVACTVALHVVRIVILGKLPIDLAATADAAAPDRPVIASILEGQSRAAVSEVERAGVVEAGSPGDVGSERARDSRQTIGDDRGVRRSVTVVA